MPSAQVPDFNMTVSQTSLRQQTQAGPYDCDTGGVPAFVVAMHVLTGLFPFETVGGLFDARPLGGFAWLQEVGQP